MREMIIAIMEWQTPVFLFILVAALIVLKEIKATPRGYKMSFFFLVGSFVLLLLVEIIFIGFM